MILTLHDAKQTPLWTARVKLDFGIKTWTVDERQTGWKRIGFSNQGSFEIKAGGAVVLWFWDRLDFRTKRNTVILWDPPTHSRDSVHKSGGGVLFDPKDPALKDQRVGWSVAKTSIREAAMKLVAENLPPLGSYQEPPNFVEKGPRKAEMVNPDGNRATGCGGFVGRYYEELERLGWPIPKDRVVKKYQWTPPGKTEKEWATDTLYLTGPTFGHPDVVQVVEKGRKSPIYIKYTNGDTRRPLPGDVYILNANGLRRHEGVIVDASTDEWITADGGQAASGFAVGFSKKKFDPKTGHVSGGKEVGTLEGWIDLEELVKGS